jgi:acyl carrier protein
VGLVGVIIAMELEDRFAIKIPDADAQRLRTPREIATYVYDRTRAHKDPPTAEAIETIVTDLITREMGLDKAEVLPDADLVRDLGMDR